MKALVLDASALIAAVCSPNPRSASRVVVRAIRLGIVRSFASEPIREEWRAAVRYPKVAARARVADPAGFVDAMCRASRSVTPAPLPIALPDAEDEMYLSAAIAAGARYLVTFNTRDFLPGAPRGVVQGEVLGVRILEPGEYLRELERSPGR